VSKIIIVPYSQRKQQTQRARRNVFSDETNLYLLRLLRGGSVGTHRGTNAPPLLHPAASHDLQLELAAAIRKRILPWVWSISVHVALLILLLLIFFPHIRFEPIEILSGFANIPIQQKEILLVPGNDNDKVQGVVDSDVVGASHIDVPNIPQPLSVHTTPGLNFMGRDPQLRAEMLGGGGGRDQTDEAVLAGLRWLKSVQQPNGAWHFSGRFLQSAQRDREDALAATAMALLAFQGFGITPDSQEPLFAEFTETVRNGWNWLLQQQMEDGSFFQPTITKSNHRFYTHAFCTIALCELLAMTGNETLREPAQRAIDYCLEHQSVRDGGWRYAPDRFSEQSDVSVSGWVVLALKSGQAADLIIPPDVYTNVMKFLDSMMVANQYRYRKDEPEARWAMTAESLLCRILLGWERNDPRLAAGVQVIVNNPPSFAEHYQRDVYYWYFATQTLYHYGGDEWQTWNETMRNSLLLQQEKYDAVKGSWNPERPVRDAWGAQYGRLYTTCMSLYILEVYYRHMRIFPPAIP
jgi:hypothetical protein